MSLKRPLVLIILDGWGYFPGKTHNAIASAQIPHWEHWWKTYPHLLLHASGEYVGLPHGQMGNSEVGHMHIGAGRVIAQDFTRINTAINQQDFASNSVIQEVLNFLNTQKKSLHIMGLLSPGGVHSHEEHLFAFLALCKARGFKNIALHLFLDGRDTPPQSALESIHKLEKILEDYPEATICSLSGRYYAMDRDKRWPRIQEVYDLLTQGQSKQSFHSAKEATDFYYAQGIYDEFIPPSIIGSGQYIQDGDGVFFFNFRADRARQLTEALITLDFQGFERKKIPRISRFMTMTRFADYLPTQIIFPPYQLHNTLGEVIAQQGLKQLRIAETEKYAHVTFFLNGGNEAVFNGEERLLISSPKVATYDLHPEMSAIELTEALINTIKEQKTDVIICNYANADMVGHTGNFKATVRAIECLDTVLNDVWSALKDVGGQMLITADHGNAETMYDDNTQQAHTAHTNHPVPLLYLGEGWHTPYKIGSLIDVAPTVLTLLNITPPKEMTGKTLLVANHDT